MANTDFPISLDTFDDPQGSTLLNGGGNANLSHATQHKHLNAAIAALQQAVGTIGSSDVNSLRYQLQNVITTPGPQGNTGPVGPTGPAGTISVDNSGIGSYAMLLMSSSTMGPFPPPYGTILTLSSYYMTNGATYQYNSGDSSFVWPIMVSASTFLTGTWKSGGLAYGAPGALPIFKLSSSPNGINAGVPCIPFLAQRVA